MSVSAWLVVALTLRPPALIFCHQMPRAATTPGRTRSPTRATSSTAPRSLYTRTRSPSAMPRAAASSALMSQKGSPSVRDRLAMLTKVEFMKLRCGGEISASG